MGRQKAVAKTIAHEDFKGGGYIEILGVISIFLKNPPTSPFFK